MSDASLRYVLDTSIVSRIMREEPTVLMRFDEALRADAKFILCPIVLYEIKRGLLKAGAFRQIGEFNIVADEMAWDDLRRSDWELAAQLWAECTRRGRPRGDADLLIAAFADRRDATVVTGDLAHFGDLGIAVEDWTK